MSFLSWQYAWLLAIVFLLYWQLPWRGRIWLILGASYFFYGVWDARFLALLLTSTTIDFFCALGITGNRQPAWKVALAAASPLLWLLAYKGIFQNGVPVSAHILVIAALFPPLFLALYLGLWRMRLERQRKAFMVLSILTNLAMLGFLKYFNFFSHSLLALADKLGLHPGWTLPHIILPVGISFYTFQSISYAVDCYKGKARPCHDFVTFAAYLSFFPQLVAGPIERANDLLPQFEKPAVWDNEGFHRGLRLILVGLFKKVFVGDNCAMVANYVFNHQIELNGPWAVVGVVAFAFQVYGDFSGYTDIARGSAHMLGIKLNHNFHLPYFAKSPSEFWQRWHITLSSWFRDYLYIPLGGNRTSTGRMYFNLWFTMVVAGLWHGASWTFVLWGAYHGFLLIAYRLIKPLKWLGDQKGGGREIIAVCVLSVFMLISWALFRCDDFAQLTKWFLALAHWPKAAIISAIKPALWCFLHALPLLLWQLGTLPKLDEIENSHWKWTVRGLAYAFAIIAVTSSGAGEVQFIYFQF